MDRFYWSLAVVFTEFPLVSPLFSPPLLFCVCLPLTVSVVSGWPGIYLLSAHQPDSSHPRAIYTNHQIPVLSRSFPSSLHQFVVKPPVVTHRPS